MSQPLAKFAGKEKKGCRVTIWPTDRGGYTISIEKSWKPKGSDQWESRKLSIFESEVAEMAGLLIAASDWLKANSEAHRAEKEHLAAKANAYQPPERALDFEDDDIPF